MIKVSIHQPCYIPYLGIFYKIWQSDIFVFLDDAQYSKGYVFDWNRIKTPQGECRLKIPTARKFGQVLTEIRPKDNLGWKDKHLKTVEMNYKKAPFFREVYSDYVDCICMDHSSLADLNIALMEMFIQKFEWDMPVYRSSEMDISSRSEKRVIDIVKLVGGDTYISGTGGRGYQEEEHFEKYGIDLIYSDYWPKEYKQQWGDFIPNLSVLDYCMNNGYQIDDFFKTIKGGEGKYE